MAEKERLRANDLLKAALEKAENDYETNLDNLIDAATQAIEDAYDPETGSWRAGRDPRDIIREFTRDAGSLPTATTTCSGDCGNGTPASACRSSTTPTPWRPTVSCGSR